MHSLKKITLFFLAAVFVAFYACNFESSTSSQGNSATSAPSNTQPNAPSNTSRSPIEGMTIRWRAPQRYADSSRTTLSPEDLDGYELFINRSGTFKVTDTPVAWIFASDSRGNPVESFLLSDLNYTFSINQTYYFSMRSVTKDDGVSAFSPVVTLRL